MLALGLTAGMVLPERAPAMSNPTAAHWIGAAAALDPKGGWSFVAGDFNGSGRDDVAGYHPNGTIWVGQNGGTSFGFGGTAWATGLTPATGWSFLAGRFAGDAKADVVGHHPGNGTIWVGRSTGTAFDFGPSAWATVSTGGSWRFAAGNVAADGAGGERTDLIGFYWASGSAHDGTLWLGINVDASPPRFDFYQWGGALPGNAATWPNLRFVAGDFAGDARVDVLRYDPSTGELWVGQNTGAGHPNWTAPSWGASAWYELQAPEPLAGWTFVAGNFDGAGKDDLLGHDPASGRLMLFTNTGSKFLASWEDTLAPHVPQSGQPASEAPIWSLVAGNFQGAAADPRTDVVAYAAPGSAGVARDHLTGDDYAGRLYVMSPGVGRIGIPLYKHPTPGSFWDTFASSDLTARFAVHNPSGPEEARQCPPDPNNPPSCDYPKTRIYAPDDAIMRGEFLAQRIASRRAGKTILGYVSTNYGFDDDASDPTPYLDVIKAVIDRHYAHYQVDGIFLDEASTDCAKKTSLYQPLHDYIKSKGGAGLVVLNPGTDTNECFMSAADIIVDYESATYASYQAASDAAWTQNHAPGRFWHILPGESLATNMQAALALSKARKARWIYITSWDDPNHYKKVPAYWGQLLLDAALP